MHAVKRAVLAAVAAVVLTGLLAGCVNTWRMGVDGTGDRVQCQDGTWSNSGGNSGACSGHGGVGGYHSGDNDISEPEPVADIATPDGYFDGGQGLAFKWVESPNCNPTQNPYLRCVAAEVLALRDCIPLDVDAIVIDANDNLVQNITGSLPLAMGAGDRQVVDLLWAVPADAPEHWVEIQTLECLEPLD